MHSDLSADTAKSAIVAISLASRFRDENQSFSRTDIALYHYLDQHPDKTFSHLYEARQAELIRNSVDKTNIPPADFNPRVTYYDEPGNSRWLVQFGKAEKLDSQSGLQLGLCTLIESMRQTDEEIAQTDPAVMEKIDVIPLIYPHFEDIGDPERPTPVFKPKESLLIYLTTEQYRQLHQTVEDFLSQGSGEVIQ